MRYKKVLSLVIVPLLVISCMHLQAFAAEEGSTQVSQTTGCNGMDATISYLGNGKITDNVGAAILYEVNSDTLMYASNPDIKMYPSSLVKIVTAILAVQKGNLQDVITVKQEVLDTVPYYAASAELVAGEQITLSDLLYCLMVGSANDAAAVIATHISGNQSAFVEAMNNYATSLGCTGTQFVNVHGLHDDEQYTTARDMGRIVVDAIKDEAFLTYFSTVRYTVPATNKTPEPRELSSGNYLMNDDTMQIYYDPRVIGGRTGTTEEGLRCLASLSKNEGMQLVCVVMGSESTYDEQGNTLVYGSFKETTNLLDAGYNGLQVVQVLYEQQALMQCEVSNGTNDVVLGSAASSYSVLPVGVSISDLSYQYPDMTAQLSAPINSGQKISTVQVWYGGLCIGQADLVAMNTVPLLAENKQPQVLNTTVTTQDNTAWIIIAVIVGAAILVLLAVHIGRKVRVISLQKRSNQYRRYRRRSR